ncbi:copper resistance protein CopC [Streptomyces sp. NPDC058052]|uniref:copper resistance CopC family protein n=1 Tax=Streptomyces sp. NPDC058052 TaxID=3346316 RepID=UPI0036ECABE4
MHPRSPRRCAVRATARGLAPALAAALVWFPATPAAAHTDLVSSTPAPGASLGAPPADIRLTFSDRMTERYAKVALTAPDGTPAGQGAPTVAGTSATLTVRSGIGPGRYTVGYRVVSADGHPVAGSFTFTVKAPPGTPSSSPRPSSPSSSSSVASATPSSRTAAPERERGPATDASPAPAAAAVAVGAVGAAIGCALAVRRWRSRHDR